MNGMRLRSANAIAASARTDAPEAITVPSGQVPGCGYSTARSLGQSARPSWLARPTSAFEIRSMSPRSGEIAPTCARSVTSEEPSASAAYGSFSMMRRPRRSGQKSKTKSINGNDTSIGFASSPSAMQASEIP